MKKSLEALRNEIDRVDETLLVSLKKRFEIVIEIGKIKKAKQLQILDTKRWQKVLQKNIKRASSLGLDKQLIEEIYTLIHEHAVTLEKKI